jgi:hypothetical protein
VSARCATATMISAARAAFPAAMPDARRAPIAPTVGAYSAGMSSTDIELPALYRSDERLRHTIVDVGPRLTRVLTALLAGLER